MGKPEKSEGYCNHGHPRTEANTYRFVRNGKELSYCRRCSVERVTRWRREQRERQRLYCDVCGGPMRRMSNGVVRCADCTRRERDAVLAEKQRQREMGVCKRGHALTSDNTFYGRGGHPRCRMCCNDHKRNDTCKRGHLLTDDTVYLYPRASGGNPRRVCKQCVAERGVEGKMRGNGR